MSKEETVRREIIQAAQRMFKRFGYKKTTIEDIAREAGKGKSSLYYYFEGKEELFAQVLWTELNAIYDQINQGLEEKEDIRKIIQTYIEIKIKGISRFANVYRGLRSDALLQYAFIREFRRQARRKEVNFLKSLLQEAADRRELRYTADNQLQMIAFSLASTLTGVQDTLISGTDGEQYDTPEMLDTLSAMLLFGICKR